MDVFNEMLEISSDNVEIRTFLVLVSDVHKELHCEKQDCNIFKFLNPLKEVLMDSDKDDMCQKKIFIEQCMKFPSVFGSMLQLRKDNKYAKSIAEVLKTYRRDQNKLDSTLSAINDEFKELKTDFCMLESDLAISRNVNGRLTKQLVLVERKCWAMPF